MEIVETLLVEIFVNGIGHRVTDAQHGPERVGPGTQIGYVAQEFERMALLLQGIGLGVGRTVDLDAPGLHLDPLSRTGRGDQPPVDPDAGAGRHGLERLLGDFRQVDHHLDITHARAVVQGDERHILVAAFGAHPAFHNNVGVHDARLQNLCYSLRFHDDDVMLVSEFTKIVVICDSAKKTYLCRAL